MEHSELIHALKRISVPDNHQCFGCGYENGCQIHGCAIIKAAIAEIERAESMRLDTVRKIAECIAGAFDDVSKTYGTGGAK